MDKNYVGKNFLEMPKPHHHVSKLVILCVVLGVILLVSGIFYAINAPKFASRNSVPQPTPDEFEKAVAELQQLQASSPPATEEDFAKAEAELRTKKPATEEQMNEGETLLKNSSLNNI